MHPMRMDPSSYIYSADVATARFVHTAPRSTKFECRLGWDDTPKSDPGQLETKLPKHKRLFKSKFSSGSVGSHSASEPRSPSAASCPHLRRLPSREETLALIRPSAKHPRPPVPSGENLNGSGSLSNWRDYIDDKRRNPYRGIRGGLAPTAWYRTLSGPKQAW